MSEYGDIEHESIVGEFDGWYRIITEEDDGTLHDFQIPFSVSHGPDSFYVDFDWEEVDHEATVDGEEVRETITCPERFKEKATSSQSEILRNANV